MFLGGTPQGPTHEHPWPSQHARREQAVALSRRRDAGSSRAVIFVFGAAHAARGGQVTTRHRLNRYGDRQLNRALHTVVRIRIQYQPATRDYVARRTAEGKTSREIKRCLTRYVARDLYRLLDNGASTA
jgi:Transposase IS116/IS110/IS902 family